MTLVTVASPVVRYRRGDEATRQQLRWLVWGAASVPVLLPAGWALQALGAPPDAAYLGLFLALLVAVPAAVLVAVLSYDSSSSAAPRRAGCVGPARRPGLPDYRSR
jgi:hypothetical protein